MPLRQPGGWARRVALTNPYAFQMQRCARLEERTTPSEEPEIEMVLVWAGTPLFSARRAARKADPQEAAPRPRERIAVAA